MVNGMKIYTFHCKKRGKEQFFKDDRNELAFKPKEMGEEGFLNPASDIPPITIRIVSL